LTSFNFDEPSEGNVRDDNRGGLTVKNAGRGPGMWVAAEQGEGIHSETKSDIFAAVAGIQLNENPTEFPSGVYGESRGKGGAIVGISKKDGAGIFCSSQQGEGLHGESNSATFAAVAGIQLNPNGAGAGVYGESRSNGAGVFGVAKGTCVGLFGEGLGTGAAILCRGRIAGRFEGDVEVTGDIRLVNAADCAEDFDVSTNAGHAIEPGTVMVLDDSGTLEPSCHPFDKKVAGVISGAVGYKPGIVLDKQQGGNGGATRMPLALMGKVYCKVGFFCIN
jgi:hypothetical protein